MRAFISIDPQVFFKSSRKEDPRAGDLVRPIAEDELVQATPGVVLAGYPDDEGIQLNGGRLGAKEAPYEVRHFFYRTTVDPKLATPLYDMGNLSLGGSLAERHERAKKGAMAAFQAGHRWISIGGGHDYGYADVAAFLNVCRMKKKKGLVLHFDAHLDCRPDDQGFNSGTPFYRILKAYPSRSLDIVAIGLQSVCNSQAYLKWAREKGMKIFFADQLKAAFSAVSRQLKSSRPVFISLDMDVFASPYAPGTSNNWPLGLTPQELKPLLARIFRFSDVWGLGIYEVSPPLDVAHVTSKLAAQFISEFVHPPRKARSRK